ncbi:DinB family protein [Myceligenerans pegani]|uniref:DinB family protein n=1 Tax=Myceligenerans pegani TaxID=2776917 RepID=A0ABR9N567_9MICO|nr:DinB family protein [Myceligenerans sp. TRM 65318]MBE1878411.1 DinB family protein [Myceligenerans sp. TRM 65318]MBE3020682.1 DinB family protein [Myceligenerans sp. TRM 65318]
MDRCAECGYDYGSTGRANAVDVVLAGAESVAGALEAADRPDARPEPRRWSAVEYAAHVRDMLVVQRERVLDARLRDAPHPPRMGRDERVEWGEYDGLDVADLARQTRDAAAWLARTFSLLDEADWSRTMSYNYPEPALRTLEWVASHTVHELVHHAQDIRRNATDVRMPE